MFRFYLLMRKEFLQFFRNVPLILIVLYCMTADVYMAGSVSMDIHEYPIAVYDLDKTKQSREVLERLKKPYFKITNIINDEKDITKLIENGTVSVVVVIPKYFGKKLSSYSTAEMQVILDGSVSNASQIALGYISSIIGELNSKILFSTWKFSNVAKKIVPYVEARTRYLYNPNLVDQWNFSLQEFFVDVTLIGMLLIATAMVNEKQFGTIEQLMVTPLKTYEIMISKILPMVVVLFFASFIAIFVTLIHLIGVPFLGSVWAFFLVILVYVFTVAGLGLFISTISSNLSDTVLFSILVLVPIMFLSGAFVPIESMPKWMQYFVHLSPLKYFIDLGTGIFLKGNSLFMMWREFLSLLVLGIVLFFIGAKRFRKAYQ